MESRQVQEDDLIINLTIDGTEYEEVEVMVTDPDKTIRQFIDKIIDVFQLPKVDGGGCPLQYMLGQIIGNDDEPVCLEYEDEDGREQALSDYNIQPGDHLNLTSIPLYACPVPGEMQKEWDIINHQILFG